MAIRHKLFAIWKSLFGDSARAFGTLGLLLLLLLAIVPYRDHFREWYRYQRSYLRLIHGRDDALTLQRRFQGGLQQTWIPALDVVDRCSSCHVALKETGLRGASQPFRPHPPIPHSLDEFGCVLCHRGQGVATTVGEAHSSTKAWEQPLLPARYIESSCGQCHVDKPVSTPRLNAGRALLARNGCVHCHSLSLPDGVRLAPSDDPPSLQHVAQKTTREWIFAWIKNPQAYSATASMPNFQLSDSDARDISAFLMAQSTPLADAAPPLPAAPAAPSDADIQAGQSAYGESFCASCHAMQNAAGLLVGGNVGPELTGVGTKVKPDWLRQWIRNPKLYDPETAMPHYRFDEKQLSLIAGFLESKTVPDFVANVHLEAPTPPQIAHGKQLVNEMGCAVCHNINGIHKPEDFAPDLTSVGSRPLAKIVFVPGMERSLPAYIEAKIKNPRSFGPALKMPQFNLSTAQVDDLVTALLAQTDRARSLPAGLRIAGHPASDYEPAGAAGRLMRDMNCFSCHSINGRGGDMAPDLTWEGSAVQRDWLLKFLKNPNTLRPALIRRMPKFNLTDQEATTLADYILAVYQTPSFERDSLQPASDAAAIDRGRQLFYSKYACQACHIVDPKKDKGYIGPTLTGVGSRLNPAWIYHWLKGPQALRPGTLEPDWQMSDADAASLTAFLMAQKGARQ